MSNNALTTIFTPPSSCFDNQYTYVGASIYVKDTLIASSQCYPSGFQHLFTVSQPFSPGACPSGYTYGSLSSHQDATSALCCPIGMSAFASGLGCSKSITAQTVLADADSFTTVSQGWLAVHGVYVAWASSDLSLFTPASAPVLALTVAPAQPSSSAGSPPQPASSVGSPPTTSSMMMTTTSVSQSSSKSSTSASKSSTSAISPQTTSSAKVTAALAGTSSNVAVSVTTKFIQSTPTPQPHHQLSPGAQAGIGVGVAIAGLALIAAAIWTFLRRKKRSHDRGQDRQSHTESQLMSNEKVKLPVSFVAAHKKHISELSSDGAVSELRGSFTPAEADGRRNRAELEGS